jgi:hypothetical protein
MKSNLSRLLLVMVSGSVFACGGSSGGAGEQPDAGTGEDTGAAPMLDAGAPESASPTPEAAAEAAPPMDHGAPSNTYPAFAPNFAQIRNQGGYIMTQPKVVAITWNSDTSQASFDTFADTVGGTAYWKATTSEYGPGPAVSGAANHVHTATTPPVQLQDTDLKAMVSSNAGLTTGWPAPTQDTIYAFFLAPGTSLQVQASPTGGGPTQDACMVGVGGYHDQVTASGVMTSYAVVPSCNRGGATTPEQETTMSMSHELIEAVTDPQPQTPAYVGFDADHFSFNYFQQLQAETGDACEFFRSSFFEDKETAPVPFDAWVQRTWSNASGAAGHDPCVPAAAGSVYFNVTPLDLQPVNVTIPAIVMQLAPGLSPSTKGIVAAAGKPVTFPVGFYSDGATSGPWTISVSAGNPLLGSRSIIDQYNQSALTVSVDKTSGQNGEKAWVTVNVTSSGSLFHGEIVTVTSTLGGVSHYMPIWIAGG